MKKLITTESKTLHDNSSKSYIRFTTDYLDRMIDKIGEGWTKTKRILLFEFVNGGNRLDLKLLIGPGDDIYRKKLLNLCSKDTSLFKLTNRKFITKWHTVYKKSFLSKKDIEDSDLSEFSSLIDKKWNDFLQKDIPRIEKQFKEHWKSE